MFRGSKCHVAGHFYFSLDISARGCSEIRPLEHFSNEDDEANEDAISINTITFAHSYVFCHYHFHLVHEILYK